MLHPAPLVSFMDSVLFPASHSDLQTAFDNEDNAGSSNYQEGWYISYVDILTLLLTLFVILLSMSQTSAEVPNLPAPANIETVVTHTDTAPATEKADIDDALKSDKDIHAVTPKEIIYSDPPFDVAVVQFDALPEFGEFELPASLTPSPAADTPVADASDDNGFYGVTVNAAAQTVIHAALVFPVVSASMHEVEVELGLDPVISTQPENITPSHEAPEPAVASENASDTQTASQTSELETQHLLQHIRDALVGQHIEILASNGQLDLVMSDQVLFEPGSADIRASGSALLSQLANMIRHTSLSVSIEGHTDNVPISNTLFPSNWELSTTRATVVTRHLIENHIAAERIRAIGYASTRPRTGNDSAEGRASNRRVSIVLHIPEKPSLAIMPMAK